MEKNNFNKAYIYIISIFAIGIAISNIISFFNGVGFALIGASMLLILAIINIFKDESIKKRFNDIFILIAIELFMLIILFFAYDFNINGITNKFPLIMRNICAIYSLLAMGYIAFRYISEVKGKKYSIIEYLLGNGKVKSTKIKKHKLSKEESKKNKELENGTFEPKPSSVERDLAEDESLDTKADENAEGLNSNQSENKDNEDKTENSENTITNHTNFWY